MYFRITREGAFYSKLKPCEKAIEIIENNENIWIIEIKTLDDFIEFSNKYYKVVLSSALNKNITFGWNSIFAKYPYGLDIY